MKPAGIASRLARFLPAELRRARRLLQGSKHKRADKAVHEARKSIKRLRAALRLAHDMAPSQLLDAAGDALRDAAHALGPLRDQRVLTQTGRDLAHCRRGDPPPEPEGPASDPMLKKAAHRLRNAAGRLSRLIDAGFDEEGVESGLRRLYKRAAREMEKACKTGSDENLHAWRRRSKDLLYVLESIEAPSRLIRKFDKLTQKLGDDHDLATFIAHHNSTAEEKTHEHLLSRAKKRRGPLQKKAFNLGEKLFAISPRKFVRRVTG